MADIYHYEGWNSQGVRVRGKLEANSLDDIVIYLSEHGITPVNIHSQPQHSNYWNWRSWLSLVKRSEKVDNFAIMNWCRQLAALNNSGLPLIRALNRLAQSSVGAGLRKVLVAVADDIASGMTLSKALGRYPEVFPPVVVYMVDVGENTGNLSEALSYSGDHLESVIANRRRWISAVRYPTFVVIVALVAVAVVSFWVIPRFAKMFAQFALDLPWATRVIIAVSNFVVAHAGVIVGGLIGVVLLLKWLLKDPQMQLLWDRYRLRLPIIGSLQQRIIVAQFSWTFSLILRAGVPIIRGIDLASRTLDNRYFSVQLNKVRDTLEHGESLSRAVTDSGLFSPVILQMIEVGEEGQKLDESFREIAQHYNAEIDYELKRLGEAIEPILLIMLGVVVLILALGVYFPLWDMIKVTQR